MTAALVDSKRKEDRSKQWDKVIGEKRAELEEMENQQQTRLAALSDTAKRKGPEGKQVIDRDGVDENAIRRSGPRPRRRKGSSTLKNGKNYWSDLFEWATLQSEARAASGFRDWQGPSLALLQKLSVSQLEELLSDNRLLRRFYGGSDCRTLADDAPSFSYSTKKLRTLEWSVARLVLRFLLHESKHSTEPKGSTNDVLRNILPDRESIYNSLAHTNDRLSILRSNAADSDIYQEFESPRIPKYHHRGSFEEYEESTALNTAVHTLLQNMQGEMNLGPLMSKICYKLLTSRTPPNVHTYNMLLVRFCQLENEDLVQAVCDSMRESHIRPNEITHSTILRFYTLTDNRGAFLDYTRRMRGRDGGLALARPGQEIPPMTADRYRRFGGQVKIAEKARMNGEVYTSLIVGAIRFWGRERAIGLYRDMICEGWKPNSELFTAILRHCCYYRDWTAGLAVWHQLSRIPERASTLAYECMLRLCRYCQQYEAFDQVLLDGVWRGALPSAILEVPEEAKAADMPALLEYAKRIRPSKNSSKVLSHRARRRVGLLLEFHGRYAVGNMLQGSVDESELRAKLGLSKDLIDAQQARQFLERRMEALVKEIANTLEQIGSVISAEEEPIMKYRLSVKIQMINQQQQQQMIQNAYDTYKTKMNYKLVKKDREAQATQPGKGQAVPAAPNATSSAGPFETAKALAPHLPIIYEQGQRMPMVLDAVLIRDLERPMEATA